MATFKIKELDISNNGITSFKCLYNTNLNNLEILKANNKRINCIKIFPYLKCSELYLMGNNYLLYI